MNTLNILRWGLGAVVLAAVGKAEVGVGRMHQVQAALASAAADYNQKRRVVVVVGTAGLRKCQRLAAVQSFVVDRYPCLDLGVEILADRVLLLNAQWKVNQ